MGAKSNVPQPRKRKDSITAVCENCIFFEKVAWAMKGNCQHSWAKDFPARRKACKKYIGDILKE